MDYLLAFWLGGFVTSALSVAVMRRLGLVDGSVNYALILFWPVVFPVSWARSLLRQRTARQLERELGEPRCCDRCHILHEAMTRKSREAHELRREWDDLHGGCADCGILLTRWRNGDREARA